jgi:hypothetical protein
MNVTWTRGGSSIVDPEEIQTNKSRGLIVHVRTEPDRTLVTTLVVERLDAQRDSGNWTCRVTTSHGEVTERSVRVVVLSGSASGSSSQYCPLSVTESNRGRYLWPRTLAGVEQELECTVADVKQLRSAVVRAKRLCDVGGRWSEPNVSQCGYTSQTTRRLEELSFVSLKHSHAVCCMKCFLTFHSSLHCALVLRLACVRMCAFHLPLFDQYSIDRFEKTCAHV